MATSNAENDLVTSSAQIKAAKVKRGRTKGVITHLQGVVEQLINDPTNVLEVKQRMSSLNELVSRFEEAHAEFVSFLMDDIDIEEADVYRQAVLNNARGFQRKISQWMAEVEDDNDVDVQQSPERSQMPQSPAMMESRNASHETSMLADVLHRLLEDSRSQQKSLVETLQLPRSEIPIFDDDPLKYWPFIRMFRSTVDCKAADDGSKLTCLLQYCAGRAKRLLQCCLVKEPREGYKMAMRLLEERFGSNYTISQEWIKKIIHRREVKGTSDLRDFADDLLCCYETLTSMGCSSEMDNSQTMLVIVEKLPYHLQTRWLRENHRIKSQQGRSPRFKDLVDYISVAADEASDPVFGKIIFKDTKTTHRFTDRSKAAPGRGGSFVVQGSVSDVSTPRNNELCIYCRQGHFVTQCPSFKALRVVDRITFVRSKGLCVNCFKFGHTGRNCTRGYTCSINGCGQKHSKYLHIPNRGRLQNETSTDVPPATTRTVADELQPVQPSLQYAASTAPSAQTSNFARTNGGKIALPIVAARVRGFDSDYYLDTYALLDPGTNRTYCTEALRQRLGITGSTRQCALNTIVQEHVPISSTVVSLVVSDVNDVNVTKTISEVTVMNSLHIDLGGLASRVELRRWPHLRNLPIPNVDETQVHLLIGQDCSDLLIPERTAKGNPGEPFAICTSLGWAINGPVNPLGIPSENTYFVHRNSALERDLERLWSMDDENSEEIGPSVNDCKVLQDWENSVSREGNHYTFDIPLKTRPPRLPDNLQMAKHRLRLLGNRFQKDPILQKKYTTEIHKLLSNGYAEVVSEEDLTREDGAVWYLPHHAVFNPKKPDKCRVVYDCAAKYQGVSLNDNVHQGPDLTNKLVGVLLRFRQSPIAFMADIEGMFMQVKVSPNDRDVLRFLWWLGDDPANDIITLRMTSHLFGGVWSPSCASYALLRTVKDHAQEYSADVINTVLRNFYVDDCLKSVESRDVAIELSAQVTELLAKGGFHLTKFVANSRDLLNTIPPGNWASDLKSLDLHLDDLPCGRALGMLWDIENDFFTFDVTMKTKPETRRGVLSTLSAIYDPLGYVGPFIFKGRLLFQHLCRLKLGWDDQLPTDLVEQWKHWLEDLPIIMNISVPRCVKPSSFTVLTAQLHHFSDAAEYGYGALSYIVLMSEQSVMHCTLLIAKSRLAPLKSSTIPRLELAAACESMKLDKLLKKELEIPLEESIFWTDSTIVLWYIQNDHKRFQIYVANRVAKIREHTEPSQWRYVPTNLNPADDTSRGLSADELKNNVRWFCGPDFLKEEKTSWPVQPAFRCSELEEQAEVRSTPAVYVVQEMDNPTYRLLTKYSSWYRLKRAVAWILKWKMRLLHRNECNTKTLSVEDLHNAETSIIHYVQRTHFANYTKLKEVSKLSPVHDSNGILRVGGRLTNAPLDETTKHPIILPSSHHVSRLIVRHYHESSGHSGIERTHAHIRQTFWITKGRVTVRKILSQCVTCKKLRSLTETQMMGNLPHSRVTPNEPPFSRVGVDYFGPFMVKRARSKLKRYGCVLLVWPLELST